MASLRPLCSVVVSAVLPWAACGLHAQAGKPAMPARPAQNQALPLVFESNQGQFPGDVGFVGRTERYSVAIEAQDLRFSLPGTHGGGQVVLSLQGSQAAPPAGITEAPFRTNYFLGADPAGYKTGIRNYTRVGLRHVYPGIDAEFYATGDSIEHDFLIAPGADAGVIALRIAAEGKAATLAPNGDLVIAGGEGELRLKKPVAYQLDAAGKRTEVAAAFALTGSEDAQELRLELGAYDHTRTLVVDPVIRYGSFFDGKAGSTATALTTDAAGDVYLTGTTRSAAPNFGVLNTKLNVTPGPASTVGSLLSSTAVFVAKFNPAGSASPVAWLSFFGSELGDSTSTSIALQPGANPGVVAVGGSTLARNLPTTVIDGSVDGAASLRRGFVMALSASTGSLAASTYIESAPAASGGSTEVNGLALDSAGNVYAVGTATGAALPVTANAIPVDSAVLSSSARKGFVYELTPALVRGPLVSYLGGSQSADTYLTSVAVDASGSVFVGGYTAGSFPMAGAYDAANMYVHNPNDAGGNDAFAAKLVPAVDGTAIAYSAWFAGRGDEKLNALALDPAGNLFVFGQTVSADLLAATTYTSAAGSTPVRTPAGVKADARPVTPAAPGKSGTATTTGFGAKLDPAGQPLVVTYLGGAGDDVITAAVVDAKGRVFAAGRSSSAQSMSYPGAAQLPVEQDLTASSLQHGFLLQLPGDLSSVTAIANIGGNAGPDNAVGVALDATGSVYLSGNISSLSAFTSAEAFQANRSTAAGSSAYLAKITPNVLLDLPLTLKATTLVSPACTAAASPQPTPAQGCPDPVQIPSGAAPPTTQAVKYVFNLQPAPGAIPGVTVTVAAPSMAPAEAVPTSVALVYNTVSFLDESTGVAVPAANGACAPAGATIVCTITAYPATAGANDILDIVVNGTLTVASSAAPTSATPTVVTVSTTLSATAPATYNSQTVPVVSNVVAPPPPTDSGLKLTAVTETGATCSTAASPQPAQAVGCPDPIGLPTTPNVTYTFVVGPSGSATTPPTPPAVVQIQIAPNSVLTYNSCSYTDTSLATPVAVPCTIVAGTPTIALPVYPQTTPGTDDTLVITLKATLASEPTSATIGVMANVTSFDTAAKTNAYATLTATENSNLAAVLSITGARTTPTGANPTVFTTNLPVATAPASSQVSYSFTISNAGPGDANGATFTLPTTAPFTIGSISAVATGAASGQATCTLANNGCTNLTIPAGSANTIVVTVTGVYPDSALGTNASLAAPAFTVAAAAPANNFSLPFTPGITLKRGDHFVVSIPSPTSGASFNLGDSVTYTVTVKNSGPSASLGSDTLTITLPAPPTYTAKFTPDTSSIFTCTGQTCTAPIPALAAGADTTGSPLTLTGKFLDNSDNAAVLAAAQNETFTAAATLDTTKSTDSNSAATTVDSNKSVTVTVSRTANLQLTTATITPPATTCAPGGNPTCLYMLNTSSTGDHAAFNFTVTNAGPDVSVGTQVTIKLPYAPPNAGTHPLAPAVTPVPTVTGTGFGTALSCSYAAATNQITCSGNLPVGTLQLSGSVVVDNGTVPTGKTSVNTNDAGGSAGSVTTSQSANGTLATSTSLTGAAGIEVDRAAHLVATKTAAPTGTTPASPINLDENNPSLAPGVDDTLTVTLKVGAAALNAVPGASLTDTLPAFFRITSAPPATCTIAGAAVPANYTTGATPPLLTCALGAIAPGDATPSAKGTVSVGSTPITVTYAGKFVDNGTGADITGATAAAKVAQLPVTLSTATATAAFAVDPYTSDATTSTPPPVTVQRLVHIFVSKTRNASVAVVPSTFADTTDPNLDEKTTATKFGANDEVEYDIAVANTGVNKALGVQFKETLPPYFTMVNAFLISPGLTTLPDSGANSQPTSPLTNSLACFQGAGTGGAPLTLPFMTGVGGQVITCTYGTASNALSLNTGAAVAGDFKNASSIEFVYQGKFQDNAPGADNIPAGQSTFPVTSAAGDATASASQANDSVAATDRTSTALGTYNIQRAAHLRLVGPPAQTTTSETPLTLNSGLPIAAEAEPSTTGGTPVFNCLRYKVYVQNSGPNIARAPQLSVSLPPGLNLTSTPTGTTTTPGTDTPLASSCSYGASAPTTVAGATLPPLSEVPNSSLVIDLDGYFGLNTITGVNAQPGFVLSYTALTDAGTTESLKTSAFTTVPGAALTVVNTPSGSNFSVVPFSGATPAQPVALTFGSVTTPGATSLTLATTLPAGSLPKGISPDSRYGNSTTPINLYRTGSAPRYYSMGSTAVVSAGSSTGLCLTSGTAGTALPDTFVKPERVLLWDLANLPAGTQPNPVPNVTSPYTGDITTSVVALGNKSYVLPGGPALPYDANHTTVPAAQAQPQQVCGKVNGFAGAPTASQAVFAVLEPVNFAPLITNNTNIITQTPGKGVSEVSFLFPTSFDFNNNDPCYVAASTGGTASRQSCDDNLVLTTRIFGAEALVGAITVTPANGHVVGPLTPDVAIPYVQVTVEVQAGATLYDFVTDQVGELLYRAAGSCDPGVTAGVNGYSPSGSCYPGTIATQPTLTAPSSTTPKQATLFGSDELAQLTPSLNGGNSALIILPAGNNTSGSSVPANGVPAMATVTAGQSVGFQWRLFLDVPGLSGTFNLSCFMVDAATQQIPQAFPAGLSCQIPPTTTAPIPPAAPVYPAIYIVTQGNLTGQNHMPVWKQVSGVMFATLLVPFLLFRRRLGRLQQTMLTCLLLLAGAASLSGCGSGGSVGSGGSTAVKSGTYYFRVSATQGATTYTSTAFSVTVVGGS